MINDNDRREARGIGRNMVMRV